ncbi:Uncharacterized protein HZ326_1060 [Fusarium oxysporum f. sp. albedinis]|nr:Uncharacterized protein HZ326_1060 [Fusarium oxysporum f. sp. albedinis]
MHGCEVNASRCATWISIRCIVKWNTTLSGMRVRQQRKILFEVESHCEAEALAWSKQMSTWHSVYAKGPNNTCTSSPGIKPALPISHTPRPPGRPTTKSPRIYDTSYRGPPQNPQTFGLLAACLFVSPAIS